MADSHRILFLTPQVPYPPQQGTAIRNYNIIAQLAQRHRVHLLCFSEKGNQLASDSPLFRHCQRVETVPAPQRTLAQRLLTTASSPLPDMALRLASPAFRERLVALFEEENYDVVQIEGIEMAPWGLWLRAWPGFADSARDSLGPRPLLVFDDHNAEYLLQRRVFETDARQPRRWAGALYSLIQWRKLSRYESLVCQEVDAVVAVSVADAEALRRLVPGLDPVVVPNGVDLEHYAAPVQTLDLRSPSLVFTGKMDFRPNVDAVLWFVEEVWPLILQSWPAVHLYIVGQKPHARLDALRQRSDVTLTGWVEDTRPFVAGASVYVVPMRMGGGTRLKVLEAMAMGKALVSTSLGCEGFDLADGRELRVADTPEDFAAAVGQLLLDADERAKLGQAARRFVEAHHGWGAIVPALESVYERGRRSGRGGR